MNISLRSMHENLIHIISVSLSWIVGSLTPTRNEYNIAISIICVIVGSLLGMLDIHNSSLLLLIMMSIFMICGYDSFNHFLYEIFLVSRHSICDSSSLCNI